MWHKRYDGAPLAVLTGHDDAILTATLDSSGKHLLTSSSDGSARFWDNQTGRQRHQLAGHAGPVHAVALSADASIVITAASDHSARLWRVWPTAACWPF